MAINTTPQEARQRADQERARALWEREGGYCVSQLVATLAGGYGLDHFQNGGNRNGKGASRGYIALADLAEQALELAAPIDDWEEAAREAGWDRKDPNSEDTRYIMNPERVEDAGNLAACLTWQEACEWDDIEPHQSEVFEHWIVSDWLADKLAEKGEKVDMDFAGLTIWARTTTGQAVYADAVIERIAAETYGREG